MIKKISLLIGMFLILFSCSIERDPNSIATLGPEITQECIEAGVNEEYPYGGCYIIFWDNGEETNRIFISNGAPGKDGINGIDGINGQDGVSATVNIVEVQPNEDYPWGGYWLTIGVGEDVRTVFISNGADGLNGLDGIDGQDGKDGVSVTVRTEETEGGTILIITTVDGEVRVFIRDGQDGTNGTNGLNGLDGVDGKDGQDGASVYISTEQTEGGYFLYFYQNEVLISTIFIRDGQDGVDGLNGLDGVNGIDGIDGVSTTITTEITEGGYYLIFWENNVEITRILIEDGQDGQDGQDGTSSTIRIEQVEGGYNLYITTGDETTMVFVANGVDGTDGLNGTNGLDGLNGTDGTNATIRTEKVEPSDEHPYGGYYLYITTGDDTTVVFVSNGADGTNGLDGATGSSGLNSLINVIDFTNGPCGEGVGGVKIQIGLDLNNNNILDENEVTNTTYVCNGEDGEDGQNGTCECDDDDNDDCDEDGPNKVELCHKEEKSNSNTKEGYHTIYVNENAVQAHLDHGDTLGSCEEGCLY